MEWELLDRPGSLPQKFSLNGDQAIKLLGQAIEAAKDKRLPWQEEPICLKPSPKLLELVRRSQLEATKEGPDEGK
jgi:CRISPR-associated protein Csb1